MSGIIKVDKIQKSNGTNAIDIDNSGNVGVGATSLGIGTTSPSHPLHVVTSTDGTGLSGDDKWAALIQNAEATDARSYGLKVMAGSTTDQALAITTHDGGSDLMAVQGNGKILVGTTSQTFNNDAKVVIAPGSDTNFTNDGQTLSLNRTSSNGAILGFYYNSSGVGSISTNANSLPSDKNFKKNISSLNIGLDLIKKLKPSQYNYKIDAEDTPVMYGLIAQELEQSLDEINVKKNSTWLLQHEPQEDEKQSDYNLDYSKLIPVLIKAIQELSAKNDALEARVAALEAK